MEILCLSQLSIKTRIETRTPPLPGSKYPKVWVSYPLKQGLKLRASRQSKYLPAGLSQLSIKTRIETWHRAGFRDEAEKVWVSYPLKQGLKLRKRRERTPSRFLVWVSYPLKQGLKHPQSRMKVGTITRLSQLSIKTRIETRGATPANYGWSQFESAIH